MKLVTSMVAACALLGLAACGGEQKPADTAATDKPAESATPAAPVPPPVATPAAADAAPADIPGFMKTRHENYEDLGKNFKVLADNSKAGSPDMAAVTAAAAKVNDYANKMGGWFPAGTGPESGVKSRAKAEIWTDRADFDAKLADLKTEAAKLAAAADAAAFKAQFGATGAKCKACHDKFRAPEEEHK